MSLSPLRKKTLGNGLESLESRQLMAVDGFAPIVSPDQIGPAPQIPAALQVQVAQEAILGPGAIDAVVSLQKLNWVGRWENVNPWTGGVTAVEISLNRGNLKIEAWGACVPEDCEWGKTDLNLLGTSVSDNTFEYAIGAWDPGFKDTIVTLAKTDNGFVMDLYSVYKDDSGRAPMHQRYRMTDQGNLIETHMVGNEQLPDVIVGGWVNEDQDTRDMSKFVIAQNNGNGTAPLRVKAYGACTPTDCDWGQEPMHLVGSSISDETPYRAVARWDHGFSTAFIVTRLQGSELVYEKYTVFHDDSDRSNYYSTGSMWKLGDSNHDGKFNTSDLVKVFAAGEYEDGIAGNSTWEEGDWNRDGDFTTADIVEAFQSGGYEARRIILPPLPDLPILVDDFDLGRRPVLPPVLPPIGPPVLLPAVDQLFGQSDFLP